MNMNYIIAPNDEVIIGAPNDLNWDNAVAIRTGQNIQIISREAQFEISDINLFPEIEKRINERRSFVLSYVNNDSPVFSRIIIDESSS